MSSSHNIRLSEAAELDLVHIFQYGVEQWGLERPTRYRIQINGALNRLSRYPEMGRRLSGPFAECRYLAVGSHNIFYQVLEDTIFVIRVLHQAVKIDRHLRRDDEEVID